MVSVVIELAVGVVAISVAGILLLQAWDKQSAEHRRRKLRKP